MSRKPRSPHLADAFGADLFPGRPRVLFIGFAESVHTHSWIDLLHGAEINVRLFGLPSGAPPESWPVRTYVTWEGYRQNGARSDARQILSRIAPEPKIKQIVRKIVQRPRPGLTDREQLQRWLVEVIDVWQPHVIHTLGLDPAGFLYEPIHRTCALTGRITWVLQLRGGSDLALTQFDPRAVPAISRALTSCDQLLTDNRENFDIAHRLGMPLEKIASIAPVPGAGGVDVDALEKLWKARPASRRMIVWPKVYECPWSKAMPVFEALTLAWEKIQPCEVEMLATTPDIEMWYWALPDNIRSHCHLRGGIPKEQALEIVTAARVMLAPSLVDGTPNSLFEAMACGALPIVSPLKTITPIVSHQENVLFARNLYPNEIAAELERAMTDDPLVEHIAANNRTLVRRFADRNQIRDRVINYYVELLQPRSCQGTGNGD